MPNMPHAIGWKAITTHEQLQRQALAAYPDELELATDRSALRAAWIAAVQWMRASKARGGRGFNCDQPVPKRSSPWGWSPEQVAYHGRWQRDDCHGGFSPK